jgi:hypothetical protein
MSTLAITLYPRLSSIPLYLFIFTGKDSSQEETSPYKKPNPNSIPQSPNGNRSKRIRFTRSPKDHVGGKLNELLNLVHLMVKCGAENEVQTNDIGVPRGKPEEQPLTNTDLPPQPPSKPEDNED